MIRRWLIRLLCRSLDRSCSPLAEYWETDTGYRAWMVEKRRVFP